MADDIDYSSDMEMTFRQMCIDNASKGKVVTPIRNTKGERVCLNCEAAIDENKKFCDVDCSIEWEKYARRKRGFDVYEGAS